MIAHHCCMCLYRLLIIHSWGYCAAPLVSYGLPGGSIKAHRARRLLGPYLLEYGELFIL